MKDSMASKRYYLAAIHQQAKALGLGEEAYRNILFSIVGKTSCADMDSNELAQVNTFLGREVNKRLPPVSDAEALEILA